MKNYNELANCIRFLSIDAVEKAKSGHPGMPMGMADIATVLFHDFLIHNPKDPNWLLRDRFVLSNGHGSMLLYSLLYLTGYKKMTISQIKNFRQLGYITAGHPEYEPDAGIEITTGPLGQGISNAVGMAIALKKLSKEKKLSKAPKVYVFCGDGCLMEGISQEAISLAGHLKLNNLILIYDNNNISIDGSTDLAFSDNTNLRFKSVNWEVHSGKGHDHKNIYKLLKKAQISKVPCLLNFKTTIGFGSPNKSGTADVHGAALGEEEVIKTRDALNWDYEAFKVPQEAYDFWDSTKKGSELNLDWDNLIETYDEKYPDKSAELKRRIKGDLPDDFENSFKTFLSECDTNNTPMATRKCSKACLDFFVKELPELIGGSADLTPSNNTFSSSSSTFSNENPSGNHINYGVREFGMSAIMNGMVLHGGIKPYGATFLVFTDYARNAVRLSALMGIPSIFVYTHDSVALGEDGPTHQPVEHMVTLRSTPNLNSWRPADLVETAVAWNEAVKSKKHQLV